MAPVTITASSAGHIARIIEGFPMSGILLAAGLIFLLGVVLLFVEIFLSPGLRESLELFAGH